MKYEAPYGVADPNASYINGNPSTGTMGSIPPAASIENPQREIVNLITDAGGTPTDADLHQLGKGVQSGKLVYGVDTGSANVYSMTVTPPLTSYAAGQRWGIKIANTNTGASTLNINGLGNRPIKYPSGGPMVGNELLAGAVVTVIDDGTNFQLQNVQSNIMSAPKIYYVDSTTGSDTLYDGTTPTVTGPHGPFATVNRALAQAATWNQNGFGITIQLANGVYAPFQIGTAPNGAGGIAIVGDIVTPSNVLIHATTGEAAIVYVSGYNFQGMKFQSDNPGIYPHYGDGVRVISAQLLMRNVEFGACSTAHIHIGGGGISFTGVATSNPADFYIVSGDAPYHVWMAAATVGLAGTNLKTVGNRNIGCWISADANATFSGGYNSMTLGGSVTGQKFVGSMNSVIQSGGAGVNYYPGTIAGTLSTGAQYA